MQSSAAYIGICTRSNVMHSWRSLAKLAKPARNTLIIQIDKSPGHKIDQCADDHEGSKGLDLGDMQHLFRQIAAQVSHAADDGQDYQEREEPRCEVFR